MTSLSERRIVGAGLAAVATALAAVAMAATAYGSMRASVATGTLDLRAELRVLSTPVVPPPEAPPDAGCRARTGEGRVPGLGRVSETYTWCYKVGPPTCPAEVAKPLATTVRLVVRDKGELHLTLAEGTRCIELEPVRDEPQEFTITGGTGTYAKASGSGTVERSIGGGRGSETWKGTLVVPGLAFDVTAPTLSPAVGKTVRAPRGVKRVRVTYAMSARDDIDGAVPVSCSPRSGTRFRIGRTVVACSAADTSGNTRTATFTITVRRQR
jgi:hypothetical protein